MAPFGSSSQLQRYYPILFTGAALCLAYISYQIYQSNSNSKKRSSLHRTNAIRRGERRRNRQQQQQHQQQQAASGDPNNESTTPTVNGTTPYIGAENDTPQINGNASGLPFNDGDSSDEEFAGMDTNLGGGSALSAEDKQNQNLLNLLYHIAEDSAKREGYIHRGVTCNSCAANPIRGIRYRCANCVDFDLCEHCEALESHPKTHLFFKVRIPAPFLGNSRPSFPPYYPGKPTIMAPTIEPEVMRKLGQETSFESQEIEALYEQFKCIAATEYPNDPLRLGGAISRPTFDKCFIPNNSQRPAAPNLIYDRLFHFYDTNGDGLIDFSEFLSGLSALQSKNKPERLRRVFRGYDLDDDGWVSREDFLRVFKAFYALSKDLVKDIVASLEDDLLDPSSTSSLLQTSQPISSVFAGTIPPGETRAPKSSTAHFDEEMYPVTLPSGTDTIEPGEALQRSHHRRIVRRDVGIVGLSEPNVMPTAVFQNPEIRPLAENPQTLQEWLMEPNIHRPRSPPASTTGATRGHLTEIGDDNGSIISRPGSLVSQAITMPHVEGTIGSSHSEGRPPVDFISEPRPPEELDARSAFQPSAFEVDFALENEGDVHAEVLYQTTKEALNELLDLLFREREREALKVKKKKEKEVKKKRRKPAKVDLSASMSSSDKSLVENSTSTSSGSSKEKEKSEKSASFAAGLGLRRGEEEAEDRTDYEGKINFEEFERIFSNKEVARKLSFVGSWVEVASF